MHKIYSRPRIKLPKVSIKGVPPEILKRRKKKEKIPYSGLKISDLRTEQISGIEIRIYQTDKASAGRYVLLAHTFSLGRGVTVHKSAENAL